MSEPLFGENYPPPKVRFFLVPRHWYELQILGSGEATANTPMYMEYEYGLVLSRLGELGMARKQRGYCYCEELTSGEKWPEYAATPGGGQHGARTRATDIMSDLERAANELPIQWEATYKIFRFQGRYEDYLKRRQAFHHGMVRVQDHEREPKAGYRVATRMMAMLLGWTAEPVALSVEAAQRAA